ncbi:MAG TPA: FAD-linked oxidase C-terminal domain-containing protein, partial [Solirubrobacterales bacterium]|nr:FAD-linked oxidase C-terminal domain-containing protein [Solirubrobacterales bacterium]
GSGTSLSGGSLPVEEGIVIGLNRLNRILRLDPEQRTAVVEPGVINQQVTKAAAPHNLFYAPDPSSQSICSIGGNLAFNAGGAHCLKHGMTSNSILGAKVVLPDGEVVELGGESTEPVGPDWLGLFVGSEGLFGIALEITLRLVANADTTRTVLAAYESLEAAGRAAARVVAAGLLPVAIEIMDKLAIEAAEGSVKPGYPEGAEALLLVELEGDHESVDPEFEELLELLRDAGATDVVEPDDDDQLAKYWEGRKSAFSSVGWLSPDYIVQDGVVPRARLGDALAEIARLSEERGIRVANVFHAGDGNLHPLILFKGSEEGALERAEELAGEILQMCIRLGGSITGEHGIGMEKRKYLPDMFGETDVEVMRELWHAVDPLRIANRSKMFLPDEQPGRAEAEEPDTEPSAAGVAGTAGPPTDSAGGRN